MKIVCGSCQAKYSIADEKVAGKVFKIRCKRCSEVIVVRGDQDVEPVAGNGADDASGDAIWHVVVNGEQAGPYSVAQLTQMLSAGQIDWEAYVWTEGFDNWLPMRDVTDLVNAISGPPEEPRVAAMAAGAPAMMAAQPSMGADPFADEAPAASPAYAQPAAQAAAHANLFGDVAATAAPFETSPKVVASAPSPRVTTEQAMTGARNENSVLFSLKNLQALATGSSTPAGPAGPNPGSYRPGHAAGEGSGLIDIRALASATGLSSPAGRNESSEKDALLSLGSAQAGAFGALGSPMLAPSKTEDEGSKKGLVMAIMGGFALLSVAAIAIALILRPAPAPASVVTPVAPPPTPAAAAPAAPQAAPTPAATEPQAPKEPPSEGVIAAEKRKAEAEAAAAHEQEQKESHHSHSSSHHSHSNEPASSSAKAAPEPEKPAAPPKKHGSTIDDLLDNAISGGSSRSSSSRQAATDANIQEKLSRDDVLRAMNRVTNAVQACSQGKSGVAFANVTIIGKTGRVSNVQVTGITGDVGSCIARAVRKARFPKFKQDSFQVKYPFRL